MKLVTTFLLSASGLLASAVIVTPPDGSDCWKVLRQITETEIASIPTFDPEIVRTYQLCDDYVYKVGLLSFFEGIFPDARGLQWPLLPGLPNQEVTCNNCTLELQEPNAYFLQVQTTAVAQASGLLPAGVPISP